MGDKESTDQQKNHDLAKLGAVALATLLTGFLVTTQQTSDDVISILPRLERVERDTDQNSEWISTWPQTGQLSSDVRQDERIRQASEQIADIRAEIDRLEFRLRELENRIRSGN